MTHTWGHLATGIIGDFASAYFSPTAGAAPIVYDYTNPTEVPNVPYTAPPSAVAADCGLDGTAWSGAAPPKGYKVVNYCGRAVLRKIRRRRRRRMLTASDAQDLSAIVGIVGKGQMANSMINRR